MKNSHSDVITINLRINTAFENRYIKSISKIALRPTDIIVESKRKFVFELKYLAERGFDPRTSGLWAQHASTAPLCCLIHVWFK